jgi:glycosyltransferase involved in cell wall biosynthesis
VLADIPTFRELWDGAALFVAPDDADGYVAAIEAVTRDAGLATRLGAAARTRAARYTPAAAAAAMLSLYRGLIEQRSAAA